ncbi:MAG: MFS transporter [Deltaproteobacteria bacterium]|nr:MFS transporter [Deltaproteobacteria bacterium]
MRAFLGGRLAPRREVTATDVERAVPWIVRDATFAELMNVLTSGTLLCAFAVALGASNTVVGLIAGIAPLCQVLQLSATAVVETLRARKAMALVSAVVGRTMWLAVAGAALLPVGPGRLAVLLVALGLRAAINSHYICAQNSWMRDLLPDGSMGDFYARRMRASYLAGMVAGLAGGLMVDLFAKATGHAMHGYAFLFVVAFVFGEAAVLMALKVPEPELPPPTGEPLHGRLLAPLRDVNYRRFLAYIASWNLTSGMAAPLFTIYLLRRLGYPLSWVVVLEAAGKVAHLLTLGLWGRLADRHSSRSVVAVAQPFYWVSLLLWPLAGFLGGATPVTLVVVAAIFIVNRVAAAGTDIGNATLAMQLAPRGGATSYLAVRSLVMNPASFVAPVLAGALTDLLARVPVLRAHALDLALVTAALVGIVSAVLLRRVTQEGASAHRAVLADIAVALTSRWRDEPGDR